MTPELGHDQNAPNFLHFQLPTRVYQLLLSNWRGDLFLQACWLFIWHFFRFRSYYAQAQVVNPSEWNICKKNSQHATCIIILDPPALSSAPPADRPASGAHWSHAKVSSSNHIDTSCFFSVTFNLLIALLSPFLTSLTHVMVVSSLWLALISISRPTGRPGLISDEEQAAQVWFTNCYRPSYALIK